MIDSEAILAQAEQGQIPDTWHVFHAEKSSPFWTATLSGLAILFLLWISIGALTAYLLAFPPLNMNLVLASTLIRVALVVAVVVAVAAGIFIAARAVSRAEHTLLVVLPDGVVQRIGTSRKSIRTIFYGDIADMKMKVRSTSNTARVPISIELQHLDGRTERWVPAPGPADEVAQLVIAGYAQYVALHHLQPADESLDESIYTAPTAEQEQTLTSSGRVG
jgi:hypothetical protein